MRLLAKMSDEPTVVFDSTPAKDLKIDPAPDEGHPSEVQETVTRLVTHTAGRKTFHQKVLKRPERVCPRSGTTVAPMIEAAHVLDVQLDGTNDARNGLPLNAALHRAFDKRLFCINPNTLEVETQPGDPSLADLRSTTPSLPGVAKLPHTEALDWRYQQTQKGLEVITNHVAGSGQKGIRVDG
jgi:putative restriction endonuclease